MIFMKLDKENKQLSNEELEQVAGGSVGETKVH